MCVCVETCNLLPLFARSVENENLSTIHKTSENLVRENTGAPQPLELAVNAVNLFIAQLMGASTHSLLQSLYSWAIRVSCE